MSTAPHGIRSQKGWLVPSLLSVLTHVLVFSVLTGIRPSEAVTRDPVTMRLRARPVTEARPLSPKPHLPAITRITVRSREVKRSRVRNGEPRTQTRAPEVTTHEPATTIPSAVESAPVPPADAPGSSNPDHGTGPEVGSGPMIAASNGAPGPQSHNGSPAARPDGSGRGAGGAGQGRGDLKGYHRGLFNAVNAGRHYPAAARRLGLEGRAVLGVRIDRAGHLVGKPKILESTSHGILDDEALRMVEAAAPFPPLPDGYPKLEAEFMIPIRFRLSD